MNRDQRVAHLEIHGWVPMMNRGSGRVGIYNEAIRIGFSVRNDDPILRATGIGDSDVKRWDHGHMLDSYEPCSWDAVTDWHLDAIDARLSET